MVYIHGGSYIIGGPCDYPGSNEFVTRGGVILVSIQYRLGLSGFFSWVDSKNTQHGNFALYDALLALKWIRRNISRFGGDDQNVTIFGESAGSFTVDHLIRSDLAVPFFERGIAQSGCMVSTWAPQSDISWRKCQDAYLMHFNVSTGEDLLAKLKSLTFDEMLKHEKELRLKGFSYNIRIDGVILKQEFQEHKRPYIMGRTQSEGEWLLSCSFPFAQKGLNSAEMKQWVTKFLASYELLPPDNAEQAKLLDEIEEVYVSDENYLRGFVRWFGDMLIGSGIKIYADKNSKGENTVPLWFYELHAIPPWHHESERKGRQTLKPKWCVTDHADCLAYVFGWCLGDNPGADIKPLEADRELSIQMIQNWTDFAKYGKPLWKEYKTGETKIFTNNNDYGQKSVTDNDQKTKLLEKLITQRMKIIFEKY